MKITLKHHGPNQTEVALDDRSIFFSYETPVLVRVQHHGWYQTSEKHSSTTSRHINAFLDGIPAICVDQAQLEQLANGADPEAR